MESGIVHEEKNTLMASLRISSDVGQHFEENIFEESGIISSFDYLSTKQLVLSYSCNE
jgi:hypothetical protein